MGDPISPVPPWHGLVRTGFRLNDLRQRKGQRAVLVDTTGRTDAWLTASRTASKTHQRRAPQAHARWGLAGPLGRTLAGRSLLRPRRHLRERSSKSRGPVQSQTQSRFHAILLSRQPDSKL